jgi:type I restriction enzyme, R subunit
MEQIEVLNLVSDYLPERGVMEQLLLYERPFTDLDALGVEVVFDSASVINLIGILDEVKKRAAA